jgi:hypothetical protein
MPIRSQHAVRPSAQQTAVPPAAPVPVAPRPAASTTTHSGSSAQPARRDDAPEVMGLSSCFPLRCSPADPGRDAAR